MRMKRKKMPITESWLWDTDCTVAESLVVTLAVMETTRLNEAGDLTEEIFFSINNKGKLK